MVVRIRHWNFPDSEIRWEGVLDHSAECSLIEVQGVADFEVSGAPNPRLAGCAGLHKRISRSFFRAGVGDSVSSAGLLPLHASAIVTEGGITAFAGPSGAGKSTTAALLSSLDYELVTDDMLPVSFNRESVPGAWPYLAA